MYHTDNIRTCKVFHMMFIYVKYYIHYVESYYLCIGSRIKRRKCSFLNKVWNIKMHKLISKLLI